MATAGTEGNSTSGFPAIAAAGRYIAFQSDASNLSLGDTNGYYDIFLRDRETGTTKRVSVASDGSQSTEGIEGSRGPAISRDARYIGFFSDAPDLVPGDTNESDDVFLHDELTGDIERVSVAGDGSQSDGPSQYISISGDGRYVAFASAALNLVTTDDNECDDIFVRDRQAGTTERVSIASDGSQSDGPSYFTAISADGRYVAFASAASNLVPGDTNAQDDIFVHDRQTGVTARVSIASDGGQSDSFSYAPTISANGQYVAFASDSSALVPDDTNGYVDIFVHDRIAGTTERVSVRSDGTQGNGDSYYAAISANGLHVAFDSAASNLISDDTNDFVDIFRYDRYAGTTERVSIADDGTQGNGSSWGPGISGGGRDVVFDSAASNLVPGDENDFSDVFVHMGAWSVFPDVPLDGWGNAEIEACYEAGIVGGYSDGLYHADYVLSRDQMAVYVSRALAGGDGSVPDGPETASFADVPNTGYGQDGTSPHWAYKYVEYAVGNNVVQGYQHEDPENPGETINLYEPTWAVTRDQMAVYIARAMVAPTGEAALADYTPASPHNFFDVPVSGYGDSGTEPYWAYKHVEYCVENDVVNGYDDGLYHPEWVVTRDQMAVYIVRAFQLPT